MLNCKVNLSYSPTIVNTNSYKIMLDADETKIRAYFIPHDLVDFIFRKSLNLNHKTILEPSFGDGAFIQYFLMLEIKILK